jgi:uncharacterized protein
MKPIHIMKTITTIALFVSILLFTSLSFADVQFPSPTGFVNDYAGVLTSSEAQRLESISDALKKEGGAELAVVIVKTVEPLDPKSYAVDLFEKWGIGEKGKDNGVLLLLAMKERRVEIEVGYGLEGALTDAHSGRILDAYAVPKFKEGKMGEGLVATADALAKVMAGEQIELPQSAAGQQTGSMFFFMLRMLAGMLLVIFGFITVAKIKPMWMSATLFALAGATFASFSGIWWVILLVALFGAGCGMLWTIAAKSGGKGSGSYSGWSSGSSSSSSSSWSSSSSSGSSSSFGGFSGGSSGGAGSGRSW